MTPEQRAEIARIAEEVDLKKIVEGLLNPIVYSDGSSTFDGFPNGKALQEAYEKGTLETYLAQHLPHLLQPYLDAVQEEEMDDNALFREMEELYDRQDKENPHFQAQLKWLQENMPLVPFEVITEKEIRTD